VVTVCAATSLWRGLSITQQQTTLWDEMRFAGAVTDFVWVLPVKGPVSCGLSSDALLEALRARTAVAPVPPDACRADGGGKRPAT
jgi:hypothetical protein